MKNQRNTRTFTLTLSIFFFSTFTHYTIQASCFETRKSSYFHGDDLRTLIYSKESLLYVGSQAKEVFTKASQFLDTKTNTLFKEGMKLVSMNDIQASIDLLSQTLNENKNKQAFITLSQFLPRQNNY